MNAAKNWSCKKKKKKKGSSSSSSSYSDSSSSSTDSDSSSDSDDSSIASDGKKKKSKKTKSRRDDSNDKIIKPRPKLRAKLQKKTRYRSFHNPWKKPRRACLIIYIMATAAELRELRGLPKAIQKQFEEQQEKHERKDKRKPEPLLTMPQWKELLESNKKAAPHYHRLQSRLDSSHVQQPVRV